jgi:hypothetical protein
MALIGAAAEVKHSAPTVSAPIHSPRNTQKATASMNAVIPEKRKRRDDALFMK